MSKRYAWMVVLWILCCGTSRAAHFSDGFESPPGIRLPGAQDQPALSAILPYGPYGVDPDDVVDGQILTRVAITLREEATVGQVNAALADVDGQIVTMRPGLRTLVVQVPRQPDAAALDELLGRLELSPAIRFAQPEEIAEAQMLPPGPAGELSNRGQIAHVLASRFPAAWNLAHLATDGCEKRKVAVLIVDYFGGGGYPGQDVFNDEIGSMSITHMGRNPEGSTRAHGYDVTSAMLARWNETNPTGTMPFRHCIELSGLDVETLSLSDIMIATRDHLPPGKSILNISMGQGIPTCDVSCSQEDVQRYARRFTRGMGVRAIDWIAISSGAWDRFLIVSAAGNERGHPVSAIYPGFSLAYFSAPWIFAAGLADPDFTFEQVLAELRNAHHWDPLPAFPGFPSFRASQAQMDALLAHAQETGADQAPIANLLAVGATTVEPRPWQVEVADYSNRAADVHAPVDGMPLLNGNEGYGTSFASPQVAGLAAYLWLLSPELRALPAYTTAAVIRANKRPSDGELHLIDAYATALALDAAAPPTPQNAPIRLALFDVNDDGAFDDIDLAEFVQKLITDAANGSADEHTRHDLNGDGFVGGVHDDRFDLDRVGSTRFGQTQYNEVSKMIEGREMRFDEENLTDLQILCFYAYSALYSGSTTLRSDLLAAPCVQMTPSSTEIDVATGNIVLSGDTAFMLEWPHQLPFGDLPPGMVYRMDLRNGEIDTGTVLPPQPELARAVTLVGASNADLGTTPGVHSPVLATWYQDGALETDPDGIRARRRHVWARFLDPATQTWDDAREIGSFLNVDNNVLYLRPLVDAAGNAMVFWYERSAADGRSQLFYAFRHGATRTWLPMAAALPERDYPINHALVAAGSRFSVMWQKYPGVTGVPQPLQSKTFDAETLRWSENREVMSTATTLGSFDLKTNAAGDAIATWTLNQRVYVSHFSTNTHTWLPPIDLDPIMDNQGNISSSLAIDAEGDAVMFLVLPPDRRKVIRRYRSATDTWESERHPTQSYPPLLDASGRNGFIVELRTGTGRVGLQLRRFDKHAPGDGLSPPILLGDHVGNLPSIQPLARVVGASGRALIVWQTIQREPPPSLLNEVLARYAVVAPPDVTD